MKILQCVIITLNLLSIAYGQCNSGDSIKIKYGTIYIQKKFLLSPVIIQNGNRIPFSSFESIVSKYELSRNEYILSKKSTKRGLFRLIKTCLFGVSTQIILEQMIEHNREDKILYVGIPLYTVTFYQYYMGLKDFLNAENRRLKSIWLYNNECARNCLISE